MIGSAVTRMTVRGVLGDGSDGEQIGRLAALSDRPPPEGAVLLADVDGEPVAAIGLFDGHVVSDPARAGLAMRLRLRVVRLQALLIVTVYGV
jgi:hypothetical protein